MQSYDLIILGGGASAFGAALYAGRFRLKTALIGENFGGAMMLTDKIENYPGFSSISGQQLFDNIKNHALGYNIDAFEEKAESVKKEKEGFHVKTRSRKEFIAKALIFATGTEWRKLSVPGEKEFAGNGVHYCALCDGYIYQGKTVAIVGGSSSAAKEALLLSEYAKKVYIIYRKDKIRSEPVITEKIGNNQKIEIINNANVTMIKGKEVVESIILDREHNGSTELSLDGVFVAIGHVPLSALAEGLRVRLNDKKEIIVDRESRTSLPLVYAAGDVTDNSFKQVITGVASGVSAANSAYNDLSGQ